MWDSKVLLIFHPQAQNLYYIFILIFAVQIIQRSIAFINFKIQSFSFAIVAIIEGFITHAQSISAIFTFFHKF